MPWSLARAAVGLAVASLALGAIEATVAETDRSPRSGDVTVRILGSAHDRGEYKPCG